jgi:hypothetical protein
MVRYPARNQKSQTSPTGLDDEIRMLRTITRRVFQLADGVEELEQAISLLGALGIASTRLANLLKAQKSLGNGQDAVMTALSEALEKVRKDWERAKSKVPEGSEAPEEPKSPEGKQEPEGLEAPEKPKRPAESWEANG